MAYFFQGGPQIKLSLRLPMYVKITNLTTMHHCFSVAIGFSWLYCCNPAYWLQHH